MSWLTQWLGEAFVYALGWTLLHSLWQGALVAAGLALVLAATPRWSANARYLCAVAALGVVMLLGVLTYSRYYLMVEVALAEATTVPEPVLTDSGSLLSPAVWASWLNRHIAAIVLCWMLGFTLFLARYCGGLFYCHRLKSQLSQPASSDWQVRVDALAQSVGVRSAVALRLSQRVVGPCVVGHLKPAILLPVALLTRMSRDELEAIVRHELAHIRRNDYLVGLIQSLIKTLYFFNWPVLWISAQIDRERENACDDIAADGCKSRIFYAETLARFSALTADPSASNDGELTMAIHGKHHHLLARIRRLFEPAVSTTRPFEGVLSSVLLVALGLFLSVHSHAEDQYPDIETLDEVSVGQLIETFKDQATEAGDGRHIVTSLTPTADFQTLSEGERKAFARYFKESLWRDVYQDMDRVEYFSHLEEPEWLEVRRLWFEQNYGHYVDALSGRQSIAERVEENVGDHSAPVRFTRFESGRMEAEIPMAVVRELEEGPRHEIEVGAFVVRHLGSDGVLLVMKRDDSMSDIVLERRLRSDDFGSDGALVGQYSYLSANEDPNSNQVSSFIETDRFYQVWMDRESIANLSQGEKALASDALSGFRVNRSDVLEVAFHPKRSRYASSRLMNFMDSKRAPYAKEVQRELAAKLERLPSELHDYLYEKRHVERLFLAWKLREGVAIGERQKYYFSNLYRKTRVESLLEAVRDPERDALELAHRSIEVWPKDSIWVNIYPITKDEPARGFDLMVKEKPFSEALTRVATQCGKIVSVDHYPSIDQVVSLYGFETHCEQLKRVLDQMAERYGAMAAL